MEKDLNNIWKLFNKDLYKYILGKVKDPDAAKDILQDSFVKIQKNIHQLKDEKNLRFWIYKITYHCIIDYFRARKFNLEINENISEEEDPGFKTAQLASCIIPFINMLPEIYKEALTLTEIKGSSQLELAKKLGISYSGAKSRVQRAKIKLKQLFEECCNITSDSYGNIIEYHSRKKCCK